MIIWCKFLNFSIDSATVFQKLKETTHFEHALLGCKSLYFGRKKKLALTRQDKQDQSSWQQHVTSCCLCVSLQARGRNIDSCVRVVSQGKPLCVCVYNLLYWSSLCACVCVCVNSSMSQCVAGLNETVACLFYSLKGGLQREWLLNILCSCFSWLRHITADITYTKHHLQPWKYGLARFSKNKGLWK